MYRQHEEQKSPDGDQFVGRLLSWPVVATAYDQMNALYSSTKEKNRLLKLTMNTAETGLSTVISTAAPVVSKFEKQINVLNDLACSQLEKLEHSYPIVTKPSDEVLKATKDLCNMAVKPVVDSVTSVTQFGYDKVSSAKQFGYDKVSSAKQFGYDKVSSAKQFGYDKVSDVRSYTGDVINFGFDKAGAVAKLGNEQMARILSMIVPVYVENSFESVLNKADSCLDTNLPPDEDEKVEHEDEKPPTNVGSKAFKLGTKVQRRMYSRALKQLHNVQLRSRETLHKLDFTVDLIEYARTNLNDARNKVHSVWEEINKTEDEVANEATAEETTHEMTTFERKAIATARHLTQKLKKTLSWLDIRQFHVGTVPQMINGRIQSLQQMTHSLAEIFSKETTDKLGLPKAALENARNLTTQIYSGLFTLISSLPGYEMAERHLGFKVTTPSDSSPLSKSSSEGQPEGEEHCQSSQEDE